MLWKVQPTFIPGVTAENAVNGFQAANEGAVLLNGQNAIVAASRLKTAITTRVEALEIAMIGR